MASRARDRGIDLLRGVVIALMALDHTRHFFQPEGVNPEDPATSTLAFFLIRWVTHFCAPVFLLTAGAAIRLSERRRPVDAVRRFALSRGAWLMLLEVTWVSFSWYFHLRHSHVGVLWAIGGSMVLLAPLLGRPRAALAVGAGLILGTAALPVPAEAPIIGYLFQPKSFELLGHHFAVSYAIAPWFAVLAVGYGLGEALADPARRRRLAWAGVGLSAAFLALRARGGLGDPRPWAPQAALEGSLIDFLNPSKYPPSLLFLLMTLGPALAALPALSRWRGRLAEGALVFGQVPMFFYLVHLPAIHLAGMLYARGRFGADTIPGGEPLSLALILGAWAALTLALWPACRAWRGLKRARPGWGWLKFF